MGLIVSIIIAVASLGTTRITDPTNNSKTITDPTNNSKTITDPTNNITDPTHN